MTTEDSTWGEEGQSSQPPANRRHYLIQTAEWVETFTAIPRITTKHDGPLVTYGTELTEIQDRRRTRKGEAG